MRFRPVRMCLLLTGLCAVLTSCEQSDSPVVPEPAGPPVWSEFTNLPPSTTLYGLWAPRDDHVIAVGHDGQIWQWDGQLWSRIANGDPDDLFAIAGSAQGPAIAVGGRGTVLKQVGSVFMVGNSTVGEDLHAIWLSPSGQFLAAGDNGVILRGDGTTWAQDFAVTNAALLSIWGPDDNDVFAVGVDGVILHDDGTGWKFMTSPTTEFLTSVAGTAADDVYAAGASGTILHYDGVAWTRLQSPTGSLLQSLCAGCGPAIAGANGTIARLEDGAFKRETISGAPWLYAIARAGEDTWAVGAHAIFRQDGPVWSSTARGAIPVLRALTSSASDGLIAAGDDGIVMKDGPAHWRIEDAGALQRLNAVWVSPAGETFAAGTNRIFRYADDEWLVENSDVVEYFDIGGNHGHTFAVGTNGAVRERVGTTWSSVLTGTLNDLHAVSMTDSVGYIAGAGGTILDFQNGSWSVRYTNVNTTLLDIVPMESGSYRAVAVGSSGTSLGLSAVVPTGWTAIPTPSAATLYSLARGPGGYLYAAGAAGTVLRLVNGAWEQVPSPTTGPFLKAWYRNGALFLCGGTPSSGGMLFRYGPSNP